MKIFKNSKSSFIITSAALAVTAISVAYAIWQKKSVREKVLQAEADTIWRLRRVCKQDIFPHPNKKDFEEMDAKSCTGIAYQIEIHTYSNSGFGNLSRECAVLILNGLAENMKDGETLSEFFARKEIEKCDNFLKN